MRPQNRCANVVDLVFTAGLLVGLLGKAAAGEMPEPSDDLELRLELSHAEFAPKHPAGTITAYAKNISNHALRLPANYEGEVFRLRSSGLRLYPTPRFDDLKTLLEIRDKLERGEEAKLFELPLAEILNPREAKKWSWSWMKRPEPPLSPIHFWRKEGFVESVDFQLEYWDPGLALPPLATYRPPTSPAVRLKIISGE